MLKINGVELEFDLLDADTAEKYDECMKDMQGIKDKVANMSVGESIRYQCTAVFNVFNDIFGEGTDKKIFGDKVHLGKCLDAFEILVTEANRQAEDTSKMIERPSKYNEMEPIKVYEQTQKGYYDILLDEYPILKRK